MTDMTKYTPPIYDEHYAATKKPDAQSSECCELLAEQIRRLIVSDDWNESLGAAIESAAEALPEGYRIRLDIEKHGCAARLVLPDDIVADVDRETLVDEIEALVEIAIKHSTEPKPLTREQLHFQRMAD